MVKYYVFLALIVGGYASPASKRIEEFDHTVFDGRIVGGIEAPEGAYPWMVAVTAGFATNVFICGGAIITQKFVITAAHCIDGILSIQNARVNVGTNKWDNGGVSHSARILARNPAYDPVTRKNDIGLIGTGTYISFNDRVAPVRMSYDYFPAGVLVRVSGWGWTQAGGTLSDTLQELRLISMDGESCVAEVRRVAQSLGMLAPRVNPELEICTILTGREGICIGDVGNPLVRHSNNQLVGIASWGVPCARGAPDIFTRISVHRDWIETILNYPFPLHSQR